MPEVVPGEWNAPAWSKKKPVTITHSDIDALLSTCASSLFEDVRDKALILLARDTGPRPNELAGLGVSDVADGLVRLEYNGRERWRPLSDEGWGAIDAYLVARAKHRHAGLPDLWLGQRGAVKSRSLFDIVANRSFRAGVSVVTLQNLRDYFAHEFIQRGHSRAELARALGASSFTAQAYG